MFAFKFGLRDTLKGAADASDRAPPSFECPICDAPMVVRRETSVLPDRPTDVLVRELKCDVCGMMADRLYHPKTGYGESVSL